jgi:tyrosinase
VDLCFNFKNMMTMGPNMNHSEMPHQGPLFLPWHRWYILKFEEELGVPLPYWDWSVFSPSLFRDDFMGGSGDQMGIVRTGPFAAQNWPVTVGVGQFEEGRELRRRVGQTGSLPSPADIDNILRIQDYEQFRAALEGLHNNVHSWVGGSMSAGSSPNDPIFFLNHANVDRLWAQWQGLHPQVPQYPFDNANRNMDMGGILQTTSPNQVLNYNALGYGYDTIQPRSPVPQQFPQQPQRSPQFQQPQQFPQRLSPQPFPQQMPMQQFPQGIAPPQMSMQGPQLFPTDPFSFRNTSPQPMWQQPQNQFIPMNPNMSMQPMPRSPNRF